MNTFRRGAVTAVLAASALLVAGCSGTGAQATPAQPTATAAPAASMAPNTTPTTAPSVSLGKGIIAKGVANDGKGNYLQTTIADTDPAMQYNPALADAAARSHYSAADLAEAQKVAVKFIAEEAIDSTLNGGNGDIDSWFAAHKDEIHPANQAIMLNTLKNGKDAVAMESWMKSKPGYSYVHGDNTPRVLSRTINVKDIQFADTGKLQGVWVDTKVAYSMKVTGGASAAGIQSTTADLSYALAKDPADGKWKIAGYQATYHTAEG